MRSIETPQICYELDQLWGLRMERSKFRKQRPPSLLGSLFKWDRVSHDVWVVTIVAGILGLVSSIGGGFDQHWDQATSAASLYHVYGGRLLIIALTLVCVHLLTRAVIFRFREEKGSNNNNAGQLKAALKTGFLETVRKSPLNPDNEEDHGRH